MSWIETPDPMLLPLADAAVRAWMGKEKRRAAGVEQSGLECSSEMINIASN
jgi:hypothetical protein